MTPDFRITWTVKDRQRMDRLKRMLDVSSEVCICRILIDRVLCRYAMGETEIDEVFLSLVDDAKRTLQTESGSEKVEATLELGHLYETYIREMRRTFGCSSMRQMMRVIVVLAVEGSL